MKKVSKAIKYCKKIRKIFENNADLDVQIKIGRSYFNEGNILFENNVNMDEAIQLLEKSISIFLNLNFEKKSFDIAMSYRILGSAFSFLNQKDKALDYLFKAENEIKNYSEYFGSRKLNLWLAENKIYLSGVYTSKSDFEKAMDCLKTSLEINKRELGDFHSNVANSYYQIGACFFQSFQFEKAKENLEKARKLIVQIHGTSSSIC